MCIDRVQASAILTLLFSITATSLEATASQEGATYVGSGQCQK